MKLKIRGCRCYGIPLFYDGSYYDQASAILEGMRNGSIELGNDVMMLSKEDMEQVLEYVVSYNENTSYATTPERIRFEYEAERYIEDPIYDWKAENQYQFVSHSYAEYGKETAADGENAYDVPWQTILALCEMMAEDNYRQFGSDVDGWASSSQDTFQGDYSFTTSMDGYFLSDDQVNSICDMVDYHYNSIKVSNQMDYIELTQEAIKNGTAHYGGGNTKENPTAGDNDDTWGLNLSKEQVAKGPYEEFTISGSTYRISEGKIPVLAMKSITNFYQVVEYHYERDSSNVRYLCTGRTSTIDAKRFFTMVSALIPSFTWDHFLELLALFPGSEREISKYEKIQALYEKGEALQQQYDVNPTGITAQDLIQGYQEIQEETGDSFFGYGYYLGQGASALSDITTGFTGADAVWIGTHMLSLGESQYALAYENWFPVSSIAYASLNKSDGLTKEQLKKLLAYQVEHWFGSNNLAVNIYWQSDEMAEALYQLQQENQISITGFLAIVKQEGTMRNGGYGSTKWNVLNIRGSEGFRDYTKEYPPTKAGFINAIRAQVLFLSENYWKKGQENYFTMQFGKEFRGDVEGVYDESLITHSYCPWWEDASFPVLGSSGKGWCNNIAQFREDLLQIAGVSSQTSMLWPLPSSGRITSYFGNRTDPTNSALLENHGAIDIGAAKGSDILAAEAGTVVFASGSTPSPSAGYFVTIRHDNGLVSKYMHMMDTPVVKTGDMVSRGQLIGYVGSTGKSTGPHLHFQVEENGIRVDPLQYVTPPLFTDIVGNITGN